jgi:hypothetical protein
MKNRETRGKGRCVIKDGKNGRKTFLWGRVNESGKKDRESVSTGQREWAGVCLVFI